MCEFNIDKIKAVLRSYSDKSSSYYNYLNKCKEYLNIMLIEQFEEKNKGQKSEKINNHIFQLIKTA